MSDAVYLMQSFETSDLIHFVREWKKTEGFRESKDLAEWIKTLEEWNQHSHLISEIDANHFKVALVLEELHLRGVKSL